MAAYSSWRSSEAWAEKQAGSMRHGKPFGQPKAPDPFLLSGGMRRHPVCRSSRCPVSRLRMPGSGHDTASGTGSASRGIAPMTASAYPAALRSELTA
jgi:hypothetical protein